MKIAILASGRGSNMQAIVRAQQSGKIKGEIICVLSDKPTAAALDFAREQGIHTEVLMAADYENRAAYDKALVARLKELGAELVVLAGFMRLLSADFIDAFPERVINIHPALLPAFPGLHAQRQALEYGVKVSGCTVHFVDSGMDSGAIIAQAVVPVLPDDTEDSLAARILEQEHQLYPQVIADFADGKISLKGRTVYKD